jgi:hypothetical protein
MQCNEFKVIKLNNEGEVKFKEIQYLFDELIFDLRIIRNGALSEPTDSHEYSLMRGHLEIAHFYARQVIAMKKEYQNE